MSASRLLVLSFSVVLLACVSPVALEDAVLSYDRTLSRVRSQTLLMNIARARQGLPLNASEVTALTAAFEFTAQADAGATLGPIGGVDATTGALSLGLSARAIEAPTLSIVPLQGEAFTRRLISPIDDRTFDLLLHRRVSMGMLLRLLGDAVVIDAGDVHVHHRNDPDVPGEFEEFRRRVYHLDMLARDFHVVVGPIPRFERWRPHPGTDLEGIGALLAQGYRLEEDAQGPLLLRKVEGRILISNYHPHDLSEDERLALVARAQRFNLSYVLVDIRPEGPGGEYPLRGWIKLRSLHQVLRFVGRGVDPRWEYPVEPHPLTRSPRPQPVRTLAIDETAEGPDDPTRLAVEMNGRWFSIPASPPDVAPASDWNLEAFQTLSNLYHLTTLNPNVPLAPQPVISVGGVR